MDCWILENGVPKVVDPRTWGQWFETHHKERVVEKTQIEIDVEVSTVFLGVDHNFSEHGPPLIYETMVFGGPDDSYTRRYSTLGEAKQGHFEIVAEQKANA